MVELSADIIQEDIQLFLQEANEQLQRLDEGIVRLETEADNPALLEEIFRIAHTIKGSSATLGYGQMAELAHVMEGVLDGLRRKTLAVTPRMVDALLNSLDVLKVLKERLVHPDHGEVDIAAVVAALEDLKGETAIEPRADAQGSEKIVLALDEDSKARFQAALDRGEYAYRIGVAINKETSWAAVRCFQALKELSLLGEVIGSSPSQKDIEGGKVDFGLEVFLASPQDEATISRAVGTLPDIDSVEVSGCRLEEIATVAEEKTPGGKTMVQRTSNISQTVRVDVSRLDSLMEQIGELVINRNRINQIGRVLDSRYRGDEVVSELGSTLTQVTRIVSTLQQDIMRIRMLPIEVAFSGLPRMVRDLARKASKKVDFIVEGQATEVDRSVIEHIRDPLVHLLRNAVGHGIEAVEARRAAGKPDTGVIRLLAYHEENYIVIVVQDDGRGLDPKLIKRSAVMRGVISAEMATSLTDAEVIDLMFASGVSTVRKTTEVSGRGVGLDVVKMNIESLNGSINVDSKPGEGTTFKLMLPLTLATIPSLLISADHTIFAVPMTNIVETAMLEPGEIRTISGQPVTIFRGNVLPLLQLPTLFGSETEGAKHIDRTFIVVVKSGAQQVGIVVDALMEQQEVVLTPIGGYISATDGVAGATILGDGQIALILDITSLLKLARARTRKIRDRQSQEQVANQPVENIVSVAGKPDMLSEDDKE